MIGTRTEGGILAPLHLHTQTICPPDKALENVRHALTLPYPVLRAKESVSVCGAGPSLARTLHELTGDILACNSAIGFLKDKGLFVHSAMIFDPDPRMASMVRRIEGCKYYIASRCDPSVFKALEGMDVTVWHAQGDAGLNEYLESVYLPPHKRGDCVLGGSAAVTRGIFLARALGYTDIHMFGADSSFTDDTHVRGSVADEEKIEVFCLQKTYQTTPWMAAQVQEFQVLFHPMQNTGCKLTVHGDGLLPDIWRSLANAA